MKRSFKSALGVTLLEILLVLAIAAMIIVMSIRYYQNATNSQNSNLIVEQIQNITAAADNLAMGTSSYSSISSSSLTAVVGANNMKTPYGDLITFSPSSSSAYVVTIPSLPNAVCLSVFSKLKSNPKYQLSGTCGTSITYTYQSTT